MSLTSTSRSALAAVGHHTDDDVDVAGADADEVHLRKLGEGLGHGLDAVAAHAQLHLRPHTAPG